jgi:hypothetical protein
MLLVEPGYPACRPSSTFSHLSLLTSPQAVLQLERLHVTLPILNMRQDARFDPPWLMYGMCHLSFVICHSADAA